MSESTSEPGSGGIEVVGTFGCGVVVASARIGSDRFGCVGVGVPKEGVVGDGPKEGGVVVAPVVVGVCRVVVVLAVVVVVAPVVVGASAIVVVVSGAVVVGAIVVAGAMTLNTVWAHMSDDRPHAPTVLTPGT
jgi:hypothetical protein